MTSEFKNLENLLGTLNSAPRLSVSEKQAIRDELFLKIGASTHMSPNGFRLASWLTAVPVAILALFLSLATGAFAQQAIPGDTLFVLKRAVESIQLFITRDPVKIASVKMQIADDRVRGLSVTGGDPKTLTAVLDSTQTALADASQAVSTLPKDYKPTEDLVNRFQNLLAMQQSLLDNLSKATTDTTIKSKIVAIRDEINNTQNSAVAVVKPNKTIEPVALAPTNVPVSAPTVLAVGPVALDGRLITSNGKPAVVYGQQVYPLDSSINLYGYVGSLITLRGEFDGTAIVKISYLTISNGQVLISPSLSTQ
jgi:hypothetical protein